MEEARSSGVQSTASSKDLDRWMGRYHLLESCNPVVLGLADSMTAPPFEKVALNEEIFRVGLHFPLLPLVVQVLQNLRVAPTQLMSFPPLVVHVP